MLHVGDPFFRGLPLPSVLSEKWKKSRRISAVAAAALYPEHVHHTKAVTYIREDTIHGTRRRQPQVSAVPSGNRGSQKGNQLLRRTYAVASVSRDGDRPYCTAIATTSAAAAAATSTDSSRYRWRVTVSHIPLCVLDKTKEVAAAVSSVWAFLKYASHRSAAIGSYGMYACHWVEVHRYPEFPPLQQS